MKYILLFLLLSKQCFSQRSIDSTSIITIRGIKQYILFRGNDVSKPLLLFLHGGPGSSLMHKTDQMTAKLQRHFVVVQWDQRETGATLRLNKTPASLSLDMFYNDTHDLIDTLLKQFHQSKLYLAGYSWGSVLGFHIAKKYPQLLYAYIAISPVINQWESEKIALEMLKKKVNKKGRNELSQVKIPFENAEQLYYHRKWLLKFDGKKFVELTFPKNSVLGWGVTWFKVWTESCDINLFESLPSISCPVYFFAGENDYQTNFSITEDYFNKVSAPKKNLFLFADCGHTLPETHAELFQDTVIDKILPETFNPR